MSIDGRSQLPIPRDYNRRALGSARLLPQEELDRQGFSSGDFWLGRTLAERAVGWNDELNLLTCASPGAGKGVSTVVPNLLLFQGTAVIIDPKGDLATKTARYRRDVLGHKVVVLDPAGVARVDPSLRGRYNPLDALDIADPYIATAAQTITAGIVVPNPKAKEPFWDDSAADFIQSTLLYMALHYPPERRTLMALRETVAVGDSALFASWVASRRLQEPMFQGSAQESFDLFLQAMFETRNFGGIVSETAAKLERYEPPTFAGICGTAATHLEFLKSAELWDVLSASGNDGHNFRLPELRSKQCPLTVYLCLPVDMMARQGRWLRIIVNQIIQYIERSTFDVRVDRPVLLMIDEFAQLGRMPSIPTTLNYSREFGLRLWLVVQDLNQIKTHYPDEWESILSACGVKQFFGVNDLFTARYVSELIGDEEIDVPSVSLTETQNDTHSTNRSEAGSSSYTRGASESDTQGRSVAHGTNSSTSSTRSIAVGTGSSESSGQTHSTSQGESAGENRTVNNGALGMPSTSSQGDSHQHTTGRNVSVNATAGRSTSSTATLGGGSQSGHSTTNTQNHSITRQNSSSETTGRTVTAGSGDSQSSGANRTYTVSKHKRRRLAPEDVLHDFNAGNQVQLVHIKGHGGMLLLRTPYYADPFLRKRLGALHGDKKGEANE